MGVHCVAYQKLWSVTDLLAAMVAGIVIQTCKTSKLTGRFAQVVEGWQLDANNHL